MKSTPTPEFRVSHPHVFEPKAFNEGDPEKYRIVMLFDKSTDISALEKLAEEAAIERWPNVATRPKNLRSPFRDGDLEKPDIDGYQNVTFVNASSTTKRKPKVVGASLEPIYDESVFYAGCYAIASVVCYAYPSKNAKSYGNTGVAFGLNNIQKTREGESFSFSSSPEDDFGPLTREDVFDDDQAPATAQATPVAQDSVFS